MRDMRYMSIVVEVHTRLRRHDSDAIRCHVYDLSRALSEVPRHRGPFKVTTSAGIATHSLPLSQDCARPPG